MRSVNVVHALIPDAWGTLDCTAIDKRPVAGRVAVGRLSLDGDVQYDTAHHGGPDQAVYAYADEDRAWWQGELGREIGPGAFGENLTTTGLDVTYAVIGEQWRIGTALMQVTTPRIPCRTFAGFWQVDDLIRRFTQHGAPGAYLRVIETGDVAAGDEIEVERRPEHGLTIHDIFAARAGARDRLALLAATDDALQGDRDWARRVMPSAGR